MANRRQALQLITAGLAAAAAQGQETRPRTARERIVGTYKLVKTVRRTPDGKETLTADPTGRATYDSAGRLWIMIVPAGRKPPKDPRNVTLEEYKAINGGVIAYYGAWNVDEARQKLFMHVEESVNPTLTGTTLERVLKLTDTTLTLTVPGNTEIDNVFERITD